MFFVSKLFYPYTQDQNTIHRLYFHNRDKLSQKVVKKIILLTTLTTYISAMITLLAKQQQASVKPIKQIKLKTFKQIYQKQSSKPDILIVENIMEPRKSFINVTRRYSTIGPSLGQHQELQYSSLSNLFKKSSYQGQTPIKLSQQSQLKLTFNSNRKDKQNLVINRIPIKIKSKRVHSRQAKVRKQRSRQEKSYYKENQRTRKLLQSPFNDDFICIEREFAIIESQRQNQEDEGDYF